MNRHVLMIFILFFLIAGTIMAVLNTPFLLTTAVPPLISSRFPDVAIDSVSIKNQTFKFSGTLILSDVNFNLTYHDMPYHIHMDRMTVPDFARVIKFHDPVKILTEGTGVVWPLGEVKNARIEWLIKMKNGSFTGIDSAIQGESFRFAQYEFSRFSGFLKDDSKQTSFSDLSAGVYGGTVKGQIQISHQPTASCLVWLEFSGARAEKFDVLREVLFGEIRGDLTGTFRLVFGPANVDQFDFNAIVSGGRFSREVVSTMLKKERPAEREKILASLPGDGSLAFQRATLQIRNFGYQSLTCYIDAKEQPSGARIVLRANMQLENELTGYLFRWN